MKILQVITRRQFRGAEVFATQLSEILADRGCEVMLVSLYGPGEPPLTSRSDVSVIDLAKRSDQGLRIGCLRRLASLLRNERPDIVQANGSDSLKYTVLGRWLSSTRMPIVYRNISLASEWLRGPLHRSWNRWLVRRVDHVAAVSDTTRRDFAETYRINGSRLSTIPIGTPLAAELDRVAARDKLGSVVSGPLEGPIIVHIGSFTPEKNHRDILQAFRIVVDRIPGAKLVLFGDGKLRDSIEEHARNLELEGAVTFAGARHDAAELAAGADLLVLFSSVEGLPGVVLEAAAGAVPTVSSRVGGVEEAIIDGQTGILVPAGDVAAFAHEVLELLKDDDRRNDLGLQAREFVGSKYGLEQVADSFLELYRDLVGRSA